MEDLFFILFIIVVIYHWFGCWVLERFNHNTLDLLNPVYIYENFTVNYFGCLLLTMAFNLLIPIISIIYWIYKFIQFICTVGRDEKE